MKVLGLTGGVGMGKSTAEHILRAKGLAVIDTDLIARELVELQEPALAEIRAFFGPEVIGPDGRLDRAKLAAVVFSDASSRRALEAILHPRIRSVWLERVRNLKEPAAPLGAQPAGHQVKTQVAVVVIPLLFETNAQTDVDQTICVACTPETQLQRLRPRGWNELQIHQRIQAQWPIEKKMGAADFVVWTEGSLDLHAGQLDRILTCLG